MAFIQPEGADLVMRLNPARKSALGPAVWRNPRRYTISLSKI
jgi:hypothetical protein